MSKNMKIARAKNQERCPRTLRIACPSGRLTQHIRLTSFAQISATPKLRICWERYTTLLIKVIL
nr:hypothetical protein GZ27E7_26 [uncultured archaeon GZfos27E7]